MTEARQLAPLETTPRKGISEFCAGTRKVSRKVSVQSKVMNSQIEWTRMHNPLYVARTVSSCTSQETVMMCRRTYEARKSIPIMRAAAACDNPGTGETTIIFGTRLYGGSNERYHR